MSESLGAADPSDEELEGAVKKLPFRERAVIELLYGLAGYVYSRKEVGRILRITYNRVVLLERKAYTKLRRMTGIQPTFITKSPTD